MSHLPDYAFITKTDAGVLTTRRGIVAPYLQLLIGQESRGLVRKRRALDTHGEFREKKTLWIFSCLDLSKSLLFFFFLITVWVYFTCQSWGLEHSRLQREALQFSPQ